jgi:hypothetical protein
MNTVTIPMYECENHAHGTRPRCPGCVEEEISGLRRTLAEAVELLRGAKKCHDQCDTCDKMHTFVNKHDDSIKTLFVCAKCNDKIGTMVVPPHDDPNTCAICKEVRSE